MIPEWNKRVEKVNYEYWFFRSVNLFVPMSHISPGNISELSPPKSSFAPQLYVNLPGFWKYLYIDFPIQLQIYSGNEKLVDYQNFKNWNTMIELESRAKNLIGETIVVLPNQRVVMCAQTLLHFKSSVSKSVVIVVSNRSKFSQHFKHSFNWLSGMLELNSRLSEFS
mgnify:CR=1 FL=1